MPVFIKRKKKWSMVYRQRQLVVTILRLKPDYPRLNLNLLIFWLWYFRQVNLSIKIDMIIVPTSEYHSLLKGLNDVMDEQYLVNCLNSQ